MKPFSFESSKWHFGSQLILGFLLGGLIGSSHAAEGDVRVRSDLQAARRPPFAKFNSFPSKVPATTSSATSSASATSTPPLECFQVAEPVLTPRGPVGASSAGDISISSVGGSRACTVVLMEHSFANSYYAQFVANYTPPKCDFDHVVINFTVQVKGRQYDRTGVMYLGDTEVWRTTTAEPTPYGIHWTWLKDMTHYMALWKEPQTLIFDLENIVNDVYTGILNTTLTATFFKSDVQIGDYPPADMIIPISERTGSVGEPSQFTYPEQNATNTVSFPRNVNRAVFSVSVKAQGDDEFWWTNLPQSAVHTFDSDYGSYPGYSPWREVQIFIDGRLAGVSWPFPVVFTGGIVPHLHRPIVGIDAFDLREHEIDVTPWLPLLCDGNSHTFTIKIVGLVDNGVSSASLSSTTESSWYITGKVFLWLDDKNSITTGTIGVVSQSEPEISFSQVIKQNATNFNETLDFKLAVKRDFSVTSFVKTQKTQGVATWSQKLSYSNVGSVWAYGWNTLNTFDTTGLDTAKGPGVSYSTNYNYPAFCNASVVSLPEGNLTLWAQFDQGLNLEVDGNSVFPSGIEAFNTGRNDFDGSVLRTQRNATADYYRPGDNSYSIGHGAAHQVFSFSGFEGHGDLRTSGTKLYYRDVAAANDSVTADVEWVR